MADEWDSALDQHTATQPGADEWDAALGAQAAPAAAAPSIPYRIPKMLAHAAAGSVQNMLSLPGTLMSGLERLEAKIIGVPKDKLLLSNAPQLNELTGLGLGQHPELAPRSLGERAAVTGVEGAVGAVPLMASGLGPVAALANSEIPSFAAQGSKELGAPDWLTNAVGITTALGVGGATAWLGKLSKAREAAAQFKRANETLQLAQEGQSSGNALALMDSDSAKALSEAKLSAAKRMAGAGVDLADAQASAMTEATAQTLGKAKTLQEVGEAAQPLARDWVKKVLPAKIDVVKNPLMQVIGNEAETPLSGLIAAAKDMPRAKLATLRSNLPPKLLAAFDSALKNGQSPNWANGMELRSAIGDMARNKKIVNDLGEQQASRLYAAATGDLSSTAKRYGAENLFNAYNTEATRLYSFRDNVLSKLVSASNSIKDKISPEAAANSLLSLGKKGGTALAQLRAEVPGIVDEFGAGALRQGHWGKLAPEAQAAILADEGKRGALTTALEAHAAAPGQAKALVARETEAHNDRLAAAAADLKTGTTSRANAVRFAQKRAAEAEAALPPKANSITDFLQKHRLGLSGASLGGLLAGLGANETAPWLLSHLGLPSSPAVAAGTAAGALALPAIATGAKIAVTNPLVPAAGLLAGENANELAAGKGKGKAPKR